MRKTLISALFLIIICTGCAKKEKTYDVTLIEVMSSSCGACEKMEPVMEKIRQKYEGSEKVNIVVYDTHTKEGAEIADRYGVHRLPTLIFLDKDNQEYFRSERQQPAGIISAIIETKAGKE